jgi:hypothetical protein
MGTKIYNVKDLHFEHRLWKGEMKLIIGELNIFQEWLSCMSTKSKNVDFQIKIDYFQNKFDIQKSHFDSYNDKINAQDSFIDALEREDHNISSKNIADHTDLRSDINTGIRLYEELKEEYKEFCSTVKF